MIYCENCGDGDCCERLDIIGEPILCDECYMSVYEFEGQRKDDNNAE